MITSFCFCKPLTQITNVLSHHFSESVQQSASEGDGIEKFPSLAPPRRVLVYIAIDLPSNVQPYKAANRAICPLDRTRTISGRELQLFTDPKMQTLNIVN